MYLFQFWFPQGICPAVGLLDCMAVLFPVFKEISTLFSTVAVLVCTPIIAKFRLKWKKVEKTIRPFRYDLNQIHYDYTVEKRNRFKGLDLIDRVPDELWMEVCDIVQETGIKTSPRKRNSKKPNGCLRRPYK